MGNLSVLLLCDVVDSTRLASSMAPEAHSALWARHDGEARELIRRWRGREIDKTDGFLVLFEEAADALGFAGDYHAALAAIDQRLTARIGIHAGEFVLRATPAEHVERGAKPIEIDGMPRWVVARVAGIAPAGATVLCAAAAAALPPPATRSIGWWKMKGLPEPMHLLSAGGLPVATHMEASKAYRVLKKDDLWLPVREVPHSLPAERDRFVGRRIELGDLARRLDDGARLLTLVGMGGTGKTRLAQRLGWMALGDYPGGVWFCDLSQARSLDGVVSAVANGLGVPLAVGEPATQLAHAIAGRGECLLILDNFEHVIRFARDTVGAWLDSAPLARLAVTSREVLGLPGEQVFVVEALAHEDARALFASRADDAGGHRNRDSADAGIASLVDLLDRLPLAIELAAARTRLLTPPQLLDRMRDRFALLAARSGRHDRHATLRATIDWSWHLLLPAERSALAQLSVFEGSFTLDAAAAVIDTTQCDFSVGASDLMLSLLEKSLVRRGESGRFDLLMSVREYAAEQFAETAAFPGSGSAALTLALARHWRYFGNMDEARSIADRGADLANLLIACRRAIAASSAPDAARALHATWPVLALRGPYRTGSDLAAEIARMPGLAPDERALVHLVAGAAAFMLGLDDRALAEVTAGLRLEVSKRAIDAALRGLQGELLIKRGQWIDAEAAISCALEQVKSDGDPQLLCKLLNARLSLALERGQLDEAQTISHQALKVARAAGDRRWEAGLLGNQALLDYAMGDLPSCLNLYRQALALSQACGDIRWEGNACCNIGLLLLEIGQRDEARANLERAVEIARQIGHRRLECTATSNLALVEQAFERTREAVSLHEQAVALAQDIGDQGLEIQLRILLAPAYVRTGEVDAAERCLEVTERHLTNRHDPVASAQLYCARVEVCCFAADFKSAHEALVRAQAHADAADAASKKALVHRLDELRALIRDRQGNPLVGSPA